MSKAPKTAAKTAMAAKPEHYDVIRKPVRPTTIAAAVGPRILEPFGRAVAEGDVTGVGDGRRHDAR